VYELIEEDDDEEEEDGDEDSKTSLTLVLDMIPSVDPRFESELESKIEEMATSELLDAYVLNEASLYYNAKWLGTSEEKEDKEEEEEIEDEMESNIPTRISFQLREHAERIRARMESDVFPDKVSTLLQETAADREAAALAAAQPQVKGQRVRPGIGASTGPSSSGSFRQIVQRNMNIDWFDTTRNFFLFLFFGICGASGASKTFLLMAAPLSIVVQARVVKYKLKEMMYFILCNPPGILLSLLPAPQQAILSLNKNAVMKSVYGDDVVIEDEAGDEGDDSELNVDFMDDEDDDLEDEDYDESSEEEEDDD